MENRSDPQIIADAIYRLSESVDQLRELFEDTTYSNGGGLADNVFEVWQAIRKTPSGM